MVIVPKTQATQPSQQNTCLDTTLVYVAEDLVLTGLKAVLSENLLKQNLCSIFAEKVRHFFFTFLPFRSIQAYIAEISILTSYLPHLLAPPLLPTQEIPWLSITKNDFKTKANHSTEHNQNILKGVFYPFSSRRRNENIIDSSLTVFCGKQAV